MPPLVILTQLHPWNSIIRVDLRYTRGAHLHEFTQRVELGDTRDSKAQLHEFIPRVERS